MSLRSLYDEASLWMNPSGYKDGKLYSQKPTDGDGDFTFSRGSNLAATRVDVNGLIEKGRENLLLQSNQFDTTWTTLFASVTGGQSGYDGSNDAWLLSVAATSSQRVSQAISVSGVKTFSIYLKANTLNWAVIRVMDGATNPSVFYDLQNGELGSSGVVISNIESIGNGWYRCSCVTSNAITEIRVKGATANNDSTSVAGSIYIQDAQLEQGLVATDYIETGASTAQAGILEDMPRLDYSGGASCPSLLLEPQRTNLVKYSEYFESSEWIVGGVSLDANNTTSPEGLQNAYKITDDTSTGYHKITEGSVFTADGTMRTWSVFVKRETARYCVISHLSAFTSPVNSLIFDMQDGVYTNQGTTDYIDIVHDPIDMGNGWWRIGFSSDLNSSSYNGFSIGISQGATWSGNVSYTGDGSLNFYIYGAQLEVGSYPTSYIPTYGSSVTRSSDDCLLQNASSIIGQTQGSIYFEFDYQHQTINSNLLQVRQDASNTFDLLSLSDFKLRFRVGVGGTFDVNISTSSVPNEGTHKACFTYEEDGFAFYLDGALVGTSSSGSVPTADQVEIFTINNDTKQFLIFPTALTDEECVELTINGLKDELIAEYKTRATDLEPGAEARLETYLQELEDFRII